MQGYIPESEKARTRSLAAERYWHASHTAHIQTALFGSTFDADTDINWSLGSLQKEGDETKAENIELLSRLKRIAEAFELSTFWAPNPTEFNGVIAKRRTLKERICVTPGVHVYRGTFADGIEIRPGEALILSSGGCPLLTLVWNNRVVAAHAGLKCLFDIENPERESVVDAALRQIEYQRRRTTEPLEVRIDFSINPEVFDHPWDHPEWGGKNELLCRELEYRWGPTVFLGDRTKGRIDLIKLMQQQFRPYPGVVISENCFHLEPNRKLEAKHTSYYHTRQLAPYNQKRNLTMAARIQ